MNGHTDKKFPPITKKYSNAFYDLGMEKHQKTRISSSNNEIKTKVFRSNVNSKESRTIFRSDFGNFPRKLTKFTYINE